MSYNAWFNGYCLSSRLGSDLRESGDFGSLPCPGIQSSAQQGRVLSKYLLVSDSEAEPFPLISQVPLSPVDFERCFLHYPLLY